MKSDALRDLIEAVEAGKATWNLQEVRDALGSNWITTFFSAYSGHLDAAKKLHDALLKGWGWRRMSDESIVVQEPPTEKTRKVGYRMSYKGDSSDPARAWLIAILKAYEAQP